MRRALFTLALICAASAAQALEPASAISGSLPDSVVAEYRAAADYMLIIQADQWESGPSFLTGKDKWYLHGKIVAVSADKLASANAAHKTPFEPGMDVLMTPYCSLGSVGAPGGPGNGCAAFVKRGLQVWALMNDTHAKMINGHMLIQIENPLDVAFTR